MEKKGNMSVFTSMKSSLHLLNRKPRGVSSESHQPRAFSNARPREKTVNYRPRSEWEGSENSKEKNCYPWCVKNTPPPTESSKQIKPKSRNSSSASNKVKKNDFSELPGSSSLLSLAIEAQQRTTSTVRLLRNELQKKAEAIQAQLETDMKLTDDKNSADTSVMPKLYLGHSNSFFFENSYASCLDEIFQAWVNLLYLIVNLKTVLNQVVEVSDKETFKPDLESEKAIITQATECISFLSQLKMKSLVEGVEEVNFIEDCKNKNFEILDFEKRISSSFFSEMETLSKKAKEMMEHFRKETPSEVN